MKEVFGIIKKIDSDTYVVLDAITHEDVTNLFRPDMILTALTNGHALKYNNETMRAKRIDQSELPAEASIDTTVVTEQESIMDPILSLIHNAPSIKPADLEMQDLKWKYLVRSAVRGKNILTVGPAGCGKTHAAKALANVPVVKEIEVTEEEYQALLKDPNVISIIKL
jgi:SpoVK/Ycf46/Vps4 family AAA+-type ATPase